MQPMMHISHYCMVLPLPYALPLGQMDMASFQYAYSIHGLHNKNDEQTEMPTEP